MSKYNPDPEATEPMTGAAAEPPTEEMNQPESPTEEMIVPESSYAEQPQEATESWETESKGKNKKAIILIIAAVAVAMIAAVLILGGRSDSKYLDTVELGEKYFADGDYEQAEAEFLSAIDIKPGDPRAKRGLAYTYAAEGKTEEAKALYDELFDETGEDVYRTASEELEGGGIPSSADLIPIPDEYKQLTNEAFAGHAGRYFYDFSSGDYWPYDEYALIPWWSYVRLELKEDGSFTADANQYMAYTDIHSAGGDDVLHAEAVGRFICTGINDDGSYILRLVSLKSTTADSNDYRLAPYYDPTDGQEYELGRVDRAFNPSHGFANAGEFLLTDGSIVNVGGGQTFTSTWNHTVGEQ